MIAMSKKLGLLALVLSTSALAGGSEPQPVPVPVPAAISSSSESIYPNSPGNAPSCYTISRGPTYDLDWTFNLSLSTDTRLLRDYYPSQCGGPALCDIVSYRIQHSNGDWSQEYYPGVNDVALYNGLPRRLWFAFYDHHHAYTFCN